MAFVGKALHHQWKVFSRKKKWCKINGIHFFFQRRPPQEPLRGNSANRSQWEKSTVWFCGCFDWVDAAQTFPEPTLVGVTPAVLAHTAWLKVWTVQLISYSYSLKYKPPGAFLNVNSYKPLWPGVLPPKPPWKTRNRALSKTETVGINIFLNLARNFVELCGSLSVVCGALLRLQVRTLEFYLMEQTLIRCFHLMGLA